MLDAPVVELLLSITMPLVPAVSFAKPVQLAGNPLVMAKFKTQPPVLPLALHLAPTPAKSQSVDPLTNSVKGEHKAPFEVDSASELVGLEIMARRVPAKVKSYNVGLVEELGPHTYRCPLLGVVK